MKPKMKWTKSGFTLIEVIITVVVLAVLAAMMTSYYGQSFTRSSAPIASQSKSAIHNLNQVMERISVEYAKYPHWRPQTAYASGIIIIPPTGATNGYMYTSGGGTSGTIEPAPWPMTVGGTILDSSVTWTNAGAALTLTGLQTAIGTEGTDYTDAFGSYNVIHNHFITFDASNVEQVCNSLTTCPLDYPRYLKVTIGFRSDDPRRTNETLTTLFAIR